MLLQPLPVLFCIILTNIERWIYLSFTLTYFKTIHILIWRRVFSRVFKKLQSYLFPKGIFGLWFEVTKICQYLKMIILKSVNRKCKFRYSTKNCILISRMYITGLIFRFKQPVPLRLIILIALWSTFQKGLIFDTQPWKHPLHSSFFFVCAWGFEVPIKTEIWFKIC